MSAVRTQGRRAVLVAGARTPFMRSGTVFQDWRSYDLARAAMAGLLSRTGIDPASVDRLILGTVISEPRTSNLARETGLACGLPQSCPAFTVSAACTSSNVAIMSAIEAITSGSADIVIAGGAETLSDVPIRYSRPVRKRLIAAQKARGPADLLKLARGLKLRDLVPDAPAIAEFSTGLTMGDNAERLAKALGITREAQDRLAMASHLRASEAAARGDLARMIVPVPVAPTFEPVAADNGIRSDTTLEKLARLAPVFDRKFGTVTAGNSSFLTDGAAVVLITSEEAAASLGLQPLAAFRSSAFVGLDPVEELLMGPALAVPAALRAAGLGLGDIDVFEIHEAFASPVLAIQKLMQDAEFCRQRLGAEGALGEIPDDKLNAWGGSLSIGHPFGATGARLVMMAAQRLAASGGRHAVVSACAAGALGHALVLDALS
ncbi:MAG: acetyl-CoA C-acyltransferase [Candidatus Sericytochromatia bacterium]|nr:acetyl-CoA C-acyltransferase [Candidatus Sericytochromatia bacterium]